MTPEAAEARRPRAVAYPAPGLYNGPVATGTTTTLWQTEP